MNRIKPRHLVFPVIFIVSVNLAFITTNNFSIGQAPSFGSDGSSIQQVKLSAYFPASIQKWEHFIMLTSERYSLDPDLIASVMLQESGGNQEAISTSGAVGLMQVMPSDGLAVEFLCENGPCFSERPTIQELRKPEFNIDFGAKLLIDTIEKYGSLRDGLKHYGPMDVGYYYADTVIGIYEKSKMQ